VGTFNRGDSNGVDGLKGDIISDGSGTRLEIGKVDAAD
jgi:hypothetical protein